MHHPQDQHSWWRRLIITLKTQYCKRRCSDIIHVLIFICYVGKVRVRASPSEDPNATDVYIFCETFGIQHPHISWYTDQQQVYEPVATMGEWSFAQLNRSSEVAVLDAWHIVATGRLRFSECSENVVTLGCGLKATNNSSEPFLCKQLFLSINGLQCSVHLNKLFQYRYRYQYQAWF